MKTNDLYKQASRIVRWGQLLVAVLVTTLFGTDVSHAQSSAVFTPTPAMKPTATIASAISAPAVKAPTPPAAKPSSQGPHDVTKVHGYWIIDVRNPDGKVAKHMEFENQLCTTFSAAPYGTAAVPGGDSILSSLLAGTASPGAWSIVVGAAPPSPANPPNCDIQPYVYLTQSGLCCAEGLPRPGAPYLGQVWGAPATVVGGLQTEGSLPPYLANGIVQNLFESPAPAGQVGISLSAQFGVPGDLTISAVGTQLFTCTGSPGPPRPADCKNIGAYSANLGSQGTPCVITASSLDAFGPPETTVWSGCIPGDPSTNSVSITTFEVSDILGQNPFSGVVLTGTGGVPGPFAVSPGQTVAITWTLTFQ
jgi:hypothetical protein